MFPPSIDSSGTIGVLVATAVIGGTGVAAEKNLCNKWKDGDVAVLAMGPTADDGSDFLVMDADFNGLQVPFSKFKHADGSGTPSLDLVEAKQIHLDNIPSSMSKPTSGMGYFIYNPKMGQVILSDDPDPILKQAYLCYFSSDMKKITMVPLKGGQVQDLNVHHLKWDKYNQVTLSSQDFFIKLKLKDGIYYRKKVIIDGSLFAFSDKGDMNLTNTSTEGGFVQLKNPVEREKTNKNIAGFGFGINNQEKAIQLLTDKADKVPFKQFFVCPEDGILGSNGSSNWAIGCGVGALILLILAGIGFFFFAKGNNKRENKSLVKRGKDGSKSPFKDNGSSGKSSLKRSSPAANTLRTGTPKSSAKFSAKSSAGMSKTTTASTLANNKVAIKKVAPKT